MFSKMTQALILSGCLVAAGAASADERNVIVPVIAGAAVGAVLATVIAGSSHDHYRPQYQGYAPQPRYQPVYQQVAYVPVAPRVEYRRFEPPRPHGYYNGGYNRGYDRGYDHGRGDGRW
jgi:opacity protein-like surface antigen